MNITSDRPITVYRRDGQYGTSYSIGISKMNEDGTYTTAFLKTRFRKEEELQHKEKIIIKKAWLSCYAKKDESREIYLFVNDFDREEKEIEEIEDFGTTSVKNDDFIAIDDDDLPF